MRTRFVVLAIALMSVALWLWLRPARFGWGSATAAFILLAAAYFAGQLLRRDPARREGRSPITLNAPSGDNSIKAILIGTTPSEEAPYDNDLPLLTPSRNKTELEWLERSITTFARNVASFLPGHFEAYVRIYHPFENGGNDGRIMRSWNELAASAGVKLTGPKAAEEFAYHGVENAQARVGRRPKILLQPLIEHLRSATSTPEQCFFAVWEGFGDSVAHHFIEPMLSLPARRYHVFEGPVEASRTSFSDASFVYTAANLWWPADRVWFVSTEVDFAWTYVGGSRVLIDALLKDTRLDSVETSATARW
jgi:hypothetical protein